MLFWLVTRLACVAALYAGAALRPAPFDFRDENPSAGFVESLPEYFRSYAANPRQFGSKPMLGIRVGGAWGWLDPFVRWDSVWYLSIAEVGYVGDRNLHAQQNVAFFPLYPMLIRACGALGVNQILAAILIANAATLATSCLLYRLCFRHYGLNAARWTTALWSFFPTALFGCVPYADSLLALLSVLSLGQVMERRYLSAGFWNGLASAVRPPGLFLGLSLLQGLFSRRWLPALLGGILSAAGTAAYFAYLGCVSGDPLLYLHVGQYWREAARSWNPLMWGAVVLKQLLYSLLVIVRRQPEFVLQSSHLLEPFLLVWALCHLPSVRRLGWGVLLTAAAPIVAILSTGAPAGAARYTWASVPLFLVAGTSLATSRWRWPTVLVCTAVLVWLSFLHGGYWEVI